MGKRSVAAMLALGFVGVAFSGCGSSGSAGLAPSGDAGAPSEGGSTPDGVSQDAAPRDGASLTDAAADGGPVIVAEAYYVAPDGSDSAPGTLAAPFATLEKAQQAMRASATFKTTYLRKGSYARQHMLVLTSADDGETWTYYPPDGPDTAVLDYAGQVLSNPDEIDGILIQGGSHITVDGLEVKNVAAGGIAIHGGPAYFDLDWNGSPVYTATGAAHGNIVRNNIVHDCRAEYGAGATQPPYDTWLNLIGAWGDVQDTVISHNAAFNCACAGGIGLGVLQHGPAGGTSRASVADNVVFHVGVNTSGTFDSPDGAGIYLIDRQLTASTSTDITVRHNFVRDIGDPSHGTYGIYLDDGASNVTITQNVLAGRMQQGGIFHCGSGNKVTNNVVDVGAGGQGVWQTANHEGDHDCTYGDMAGNSFTGNIVIGAGADNLGYGYSSYGPVNYIQPLIRDNFYRNYTGSGINATGSGGVNGDANPISGDPMISGWEYTVAPNSPAFASPVSWTAIPGGWGPPGYVIPQTGTPPSSPH